MTDETTIKITLAYNGYIIRIGGFPDARDPMGTTTGAVLVAHTHEEAMGMIGARIPNGQGRSDQADIEDFMRRHASGAGL